jgi:AraC-like DNA-binding protein
MIPFIVSAHSYSYRGRPAEGRRMGSTYAFHLFMSNHAHMIVGDRKLPLTKGTLVFVRPEQWHSFHIADHPLPSYNIYFTLWDNERKGPAAPKFSLFPNKLREDMIVRREPCAELDQLPVSYSIQPFQQLHDMFIHMIRIFEQSAYYRSEAANSLLYSWMLQLYNTFLIPETSDPRITQLIAKIESHPQNYLRYEQWNELCGLQKSHFYGLFKKVTGLTPGAFLLKVRMRNAAVRLQESKHSITDIADELGYSSIHYFTRQFSAYYGMNPTAYRSRSWR